MKPSRTILLAVILSFAAHIIFFASSPYIMLPGMREVMLETRRMFRLKEVEEKTASVQLFDQERPSSPALKMAQQGPSLEQVSFKKMMLEEKLPEQLPIEDKKEMMVEQIDDVMPEPSEFDPDKAIEAEEKKAREEAEPEKRSLSDLLMKEDLAERRVTARSGETELKISPERSSAGDVLSADEIWEPSAAGAFSAGTGEIAALEGDAQMAGYEDIGRHLEVALQTYTDPASGEKYFRLLIRVKKGSRLAVIPKEMVFLIDSSKSITEEKLEEIKEGLVDSLQELNPGDRFNVVAFRGDLVKFRERPVAGSARNVTSARQFVGQLKAVGQTDVENALLGIIGEPATMYPSYIILASDGRPTTGAMDSRRIIQEITRQNKMMRPIFCFGGGRRVNKYLLDFISYQNRAWSRFSATNYEIEKDFEALYRQVKDPFLLNMRYRLIGVDAKEVYPKFLSDFYLGKPFTLYGRFQDEDDFSMQLLGQIGGSTKEFIFQKSLKEAEQGGPEIAEQWAFMKMYYLISRNTMGMGSASGLRSEIDRLSRKYGITTPYDIKDGD